MSNDDPGDLIPPRRPSFGKIAARSLASPVNLAVASAASAGALALQSWPLVALGGAAYAALVAWDLASPDFWRKVVARDTAARGGADEMPLPRRIEDPHLRDAAAAILAAREALDRLLDEAPPDVAAQLGAVTVAVKELEGRAATLLRRGDQLVRYLKQSNAAKVQAAIEHLLRSAAAASDPGARDQYGRSVAALEEQLAALTDIASAVDRIRASLALILATLEGLSAKVVRMAAIDAQAMDNLSGDMNAELERMNREIDTFEETLRHLATPKAVAT